MNRNYVFILIAVTIAVILITVFSLMSATMTLDQIIKNKDCVALSKWEEKHMFDDNLSISSEQLSGAMKLAMECVGQVLKNSSISMDLFASQRNVMGVLDEILMKRDCEGLVIWSDDNGFMPLGMTQEKLASIHVLERSCKNK